MELRSFKNKTQYAAVSRRIHDYLVPSLNAGAKCISPSRLCETVSRLKKNLITPYQTEQYPVSLPLPPPLLPPFEAAMERTGYKTTRAASALEAISKEFANTRKTIPACLRSVVKKKGARFIFEPHDSGVFSSRTHFEPTP